MTRLPGLAITALLTAICIVRCYTKMVRTAIISAAAIVLLLIIVRTGSFASDIGTKPCFENSPVDLREEIDVSSFSSEQEHTSSALADVVAAKRRTETLFNAVDMSKADYMRDYAHAELAAEGALALAVKAFGKGGLCTTPLIDELAATAAYAGNIDKALDLYLQAIHIVETSNQEEAIDATPKSRAEHIEQNQRFLAELYHNIAALYEMQGGEDALLMADNYERKERTIRELRGIDYSRVQSWLPPLMGEKSYIGPTTGARLLEQLALESMGTPELQEFYHWHALQILDHQGGSRTPLYWSILSNYADAVLQLSDLQGNRADLDVATRLQESLLAHARQERDRVDVGVSSIALGQSRLKSGDYASAAELFRESARLQSQSQSARQALFSPFLAHLYLAQAEIGLGKLSEARTEVDLARSIAIADKSNPAVLEALALIDYCNGNVPDARQKLTILLSDDKLEPDLESRHLRFLAELSRKEGHLEQSVSLLTQSSDLLERSAAGTESLLSVGIAPGTRQLADSLDQAISLGLGAGSQAGPIRFAAELSFRVKSRQVARSAEAQNHLRRKPFGAEVKLQQLREINSAIGTLFLEYASNPGAIPDWIELDRLLAKRSELMVDFNRQQTSTKQELNTSVSLRQMQERLSVDSVLAQVAVFHRFDLVGSELQCYPSSDPHYAVMLIRHAGVPELYDVGSVASVNAQIDNLRKLISSTVSSNSTSRESTETPAYPEIQIRKAAHELYETIFPRGLPGVRRLIISPDGELNSLPFAALVTEDGHYLVEHMPVTVMTLPTELVNNTAFSHKLTEQRVVVFADPDVDHPPSSFSAPLARCV
jgi:CHAT domain